MSVHRLARPSFSLVAACVAVTLAVAFSFAAAQSRRPGAGMERGVLLPTFRIFTQGSSVLKLNTENGAVSIMRGSGGMSGSGEEWQRRVAPVSGSTSGMLDIQRVDGPSASLFLVDVLGTRSWILKGTGIEAGSWHEMPDKR